MSLVVYPRCARRLAAPLLALALAACRQFPETRVSNDLETQGREIFRYDTFGNEVFWTDTARLHEIVNELGALRALTLGFKVDVSQFSVPAFLVRGPWSNAATKYLLKKGAVVGVRAQFDDDNQITRIGITCALCHSTVDNALLPGVGHRLDGWPNRDLNVGAVLAELPVYTAAQKETLRAWPRGTYDPRFNFDGKSNPLVLPPAHGLAQVVNETYTAEGPISYWNAYVAITQMHGQGNFSDPRLGIDVRHNPDMVTSKLEALRVYQHSLPAPPEPGASYDRSAAGRGRAVFDANCASCHTQGNLTDNNAGTLHAPSETGMDSAYAARTSQKRYRTTPLRALWQHPPYFHDGSAESLDDVVEHYNRVRNLRLSGSQKRDLVQYLRSL